MGVLLGVFMLNARSVEPQGVPESYALTRFGLAIRASSTETGGGGGG